MREGIALLHGVQVGFCCALDTAFQVTEAVKVLSLPSLQVTVLVFYSSWNNQQ